MMPLIIVATFSAVFNITIMPETFRKKGINFNPLAMLGYSHGIIIWRHSG